jgi:hypothetical protein
VRLMCGDFPSPLLRLVLESGVLAMTFFALQAFVAGQKALYVEFLRGLSRGRSSITTPKFAWRHGDQRVEVHARDIKDRASARRT